MADPTDPYDLETANSRFAAASEADSDKGFFDAINNAAKAEQAGALAPTWTGNLPKNLAVGAYKAALNTIETGVDLAELSVPGTDGAVPAIPPLAPARLISELAPEFFESAHSLANEWTANNTLGDDITQGVAQFAIPFAAYMRAAGGFQAGQTMLNVTKAAGAEAAAAGTAFEPHEGRLADLVQLGRESEGRFGELLRKVSPDGSLLNSYINYITDRENEGEWEGRFKNAVDSLAGSAAIAGVLKGAAVGFRSARKIAAEPAKVGRAAQRGSIGTEPPKPPTDELNDIERARALKNTVVEEVPGEHIVLEGDTLNTNAEVIPIRRTVDELFDEHGIGWTPDQRNVEYRGFAVKMPASRFLGLARGMNEAAERADPAGSFRFLTSELRRGEKIAPLSLYAEWDEKAGTWAVTGHEGRHRALAVQEIVGDPGARVPVAVIPRGELRARHITPDMRRAPVISEDGSKIATFEELSQE